jgi:uncharacterized protein
MKNANGGYYAAIDADSEGVEGKFYVWDKTEIDALLGKDADLFNTYYDISPHGNWEEKNILRILRPLEEVAKQFNISLADAESNIEASKKTLLSQRNKRIRPSTDDKILLGWNALLITAFCKAYAVLQDDKYKVAAEDLFEFIEKSFLIETSNYYHTYKNAEAKYPAFLDDYAYYIEACIHLQEITANEKYLHKAKQLTVHVFENFMDEESGYFFFTSKKQVDVIIRKIELYDGATPSANGVMAKNLHYLSIVFSNKEWHQKSVSMIESLKTIVSKHPNSFGIWAALTINIAAGINEIAIIGTNMIPLLKEMLLHFVPNKILQATDVISDMPLLTEKPIFKKTFLYLCLNSTCKFPYDTTAEMMGVIEKQVF